VRPERVQIDVSETVVPVALVVERRGAKTLVLDCARSTIFLVEIERVTNADLLHRLGERSGPRWRHDQMVVRRHQRKGVDLDAVRQTRRDDGAQQVVVIRLVADDGAAVDPAWKDMDALIGNVRQESSRHWLG
jgi:predicted acetyltransferase